MADRKGEGGQIDLRRYSFTSFVWFGVVVVNRFICDMVKKWRGLGDLCELV